MHRYNNQERLHADRQRQRSILITRKSPETEYLEHKTRKSPITREIVSADEVRLCHCCAIVMSSETVQRAAPVHPPTRSAADREAAPTGCHVYAACTAFGGRAGNYVFGKAYGVGTNLHYHFYSGFSALNDRFEQDYFAAGPQSYYNPYAYVPFYLLVILGLPGLAVGTVLAMIHSVVLWLTYELACRVCPSEDRKDRFFFGLCATVLGVS